jgi:chitosanase
VKISGRMIGIGVTATLVASTPFVIAYAAGAAAESLLSQGRPATSSSVETSSLGPANAVDGKTGTRWASNEGSDPQWIRVDLGASHAVSRVVLTWEAAYARAFQLQTSPDGSTWTTVYSTTTGSGGVQDLTVSGTGRYVRMNGTARATQYGYSLFEFQVYGT